ncbi:MAG: DUF3426 domain-containing protein [Cenarchaeum sp. SB0665_bin_23]|nr:DUF3426 domain-containing protein [Cenarchaeum sp. SB0665_bin_23]MYG33293.1 DUF3426 domain-containing protein [Cenarchaeum sp. SB0677_bin_16]
MVGLFVLATATTATIPQAWADVTIQNDRAYIGHDGSLHIVGEVSNNLEAPLGRVSVEATIYDVHGKELLTAEGWSLVNTIMPGMKGPFDIVVYKPGMGDMGGYTLAAKYSIHAPKSQVIDVTSAELRRSSQGDLFITGTVVNRGEITANMISVVATIYDRDGKVATVARTQSELDHLRAEHQGVFVLSVPEKDQTSEIAHYTLVAESEEYAAVPEFPLSTSLILAISLAAYIMLNRHPAMSGITKTPDAERYPL